MILFTILTIMAIIAAVIAIVVGGTTVVVFGDFIVFALIMWVIVKLIFRKK